MHKHDPETLADRIYEAAFVPELWPDVLDDLVSLSRSSAGSILLFTGLDKPPIYQTTELTREALHVFTTTDRWRNSHRASAIYQNVANGDFSRFTYLDPLLTPRQIAEDTVRRSLTELGLDAQITTLIPMLTGEFISYTFERRIGEGIHPPEAVRLLDALRPHLARSALMSARLRLERARATVSTLEAIGLPAAVMHRSGRVLATNSLFDAADRLFKPLAFGGIGLADTGAASLFKTAVETVGGHGGVRSIPMAGSEDRQACVIHVIPLHRSAHDLFSSGDMLVAATMVGTAAQAPMASILTGLFDLSPAEVKLSIAIAAGESLQGAAARNGITISTARTYLTRVFAKTGTHRQGELMALLRSTSPL